MCIYLFLFPVRRFKAPELGFFTSSASFACALKLTHLVLKN